MNRKRKKRKKKEIRQNCELVEKRGKKAVLLVLNCKYRIEEESFFLFLLFLLFSATIAHSAILRSTTRIYDTKTHKS